MPHPSWWCRLLIACPVLRLSCTGMDARPPRMQVGWASRYGPGVYGRSTASSGPFSRHELTAPIAR
jgi:rare lipoprotein A (peptidoglycan hydrolase)